MRDAPAYVQYTFGRLSPCAAFLKDFHEDEMDPHSDTGERAIELWLKNPSGKTCRCGAPLANWEALNRMCGPCATADEARAKMLKRYENALERAGVPARYLEYTLISWKGEVSRHLLDWAHDSRARGFLLITGANGRGKTHLAMILLDQAAQSRQSIAWASARNLASLLMDDKFVDFHPLATRLQRANVLLLDDLGAEPGKAWAEDAISELLDFRFQHGRKTILTSNLSLEEIYTANPRIGSRIGEGISYPISGGEDFRLLSMAGRAK
jgi:hypothetical protein